MILAVLLVSKPVTANSYIKMITTKPEGYVVEHNDSSRVGVTSYYGTNQKIMTSSPVIVNDGVKYEAWLKAQQNKDNNYSIHNDVQDFLYFASGMFFVRFLYDVVGPYHKNHLIK